MSKLSDFLGRSEGEDDKESVHDEGMEWYAAVTCQHCGVDVEEQKLFPVDRVLAWTCPKGHRSMIENYSAF